MDLIRYPGNKMTIANKLANMVPIDVREYREPFLGSAVVLRALWRLHEERGWHPKYWANDINRDLIVFYKALQSDPHLAQRMLDLRARLTPEDVHAEEIERLFAVYRHEFVYHGDPLAFWFLSRFAFGQFVRRDHAYISSFGGAKRQFGIGLSQVTPESLSEAQRIFANVKLTCASYHALFTQPGTDVFILADPPYYFGVPGRLHEYSWGRKEHEQFLDVLRQTRHRFLLTYGYSAFALSRLKKMPFRTVIQDMCYGGSIRRTRSGRELIVTNY